VSQRPARVVVALLAATSMLLATSGTPASSDPERRSDAARVVREAPAAAVGATAGDGTATEVGTEAELREAWADPMRRRIDLTADIYLRNCHLGDPMRESPYPVVVDGHGFALQQTCFEKRLLRQDGTGHVQLQHLGLHRGGSDGPGAALTSRGEITLVDCTITQNLAEEPGGGVFSMRRVTVVDSRISGNLANDDGGGVYARRGGVRVFDSVLSHNLVDGSGGAVGSTGDILVVRSRVDGNTTDGDGGALYADESGDVTVIDSSVDGSDADGPGGAIFTLDGDVAVLGSTLNGNRADDRGGAISGEADVLVVNSTIARNLAVAHVGGGVWARGDLVVVNSTITDNYAEGVGGGLLAAAGLSLIDSTVSNNVAPVGANLGVGGPFTSVGSVIGPARYVDTTGDSQPSRLSCRVNEVVSQGYNFLSDTSCALAGDTDVHDPLGPGLGSLEDDPLGRVLVPAATSPVLARIPTGGCLPTLPDQLGAAQLIERDVDWPELLARDQLGNLRDDGIACDIGAFQSGRTP
jgi:hypothetical protein